MGFGCRDSLCEDFKYETEKQGLRAAELGSICHEPDSLLKSPRKEKKLLKRNCAEKGLTLAGRKQSLELPFLR